MKKIKNGTHSTTRYIAVDGIYRYTLRDNQDTLGFRESLWYKKHVMEQNTGPVISRISYSKT